MHVCIYLEAFGLHSPWSNQTSLWIPPTWETQKAVPKSERSGRHACFLLASYYGSVWPRTPTHRRQEEKSSFSSLHPLPKQPVSGLRWCLLPTKSLFFQPCQRPVTTREMVPLPVCCPGSVSQRTDIWGIFVPFSVSGNKKVLLAVFPPVFTLQF